jgi:hypothetical protein
MWKRQEWLAFFGFHIDSLAAILLAVISALLQQVRVISNNQTPKQLIAFLTTQHKHILTIFSQMQPTFCNPNRFWEIYAYKSREFLSGVDCAIYLLSKKIDIHIQMTLKEKKKKKKEIGIQNVQNMYRIRNEWANKAGRDHFMSLKQVHI